MGVQIDSFRLDVFPVTEAEYGQFVTRFPEWRRDRVARIKADTSYLSHWSRPERAGDDIDPQAPVTHVSWFAAKAYCAAQGKRLPTEDVWEYVAAASETEPDARNDPAYVQSLLDWYARPNPARLPPVGRGAANDFGVEDLHGLVWEWVLDFNSTLITEDARQSGDGTEGLFCGGGAVGASDPANYAAFVRYAFRSSLQASYTTENLGFRCAADGVAP
jgi:formylglycine-generating enzyme